MFKVYSYVRFSSKAQEFGDSQRRQFTRAQEYCRKNGLTLETTTFEDLGVSAWRGRNVDKGQLGVFLKAVDSGLIASDSTLLVEHLDRVTRERPMQAHKLFIDIVNRGLTLVTLNDEQTYNETTINGDMSKLFVAVIKLGAASEENEKRSVRIREAFASHAELGIVRGRCPAWLKRSPDKKSYLPITRHIVVVKRMFSLSLSGYGIYQIAATLNKERVPHFSLPRKDKTKVLTWKGSQVARILRSPTAIGHMNARTYGEVREHTYPAIIEPSLFYAVGEAMDRRNTVKPGRKGDEKISNLLAGKGLLRCECGSSVKFIRGSRPHVKCEDAISGGACEAPWFNYERVESELLSVLLLDLDELVVRSPQVDEPDPRPKIRAQIEERKVKRKRLVAFIEDHDTLDDDFNERLNLLKREIEERQEILRALDAAAARAPDEAAEKNLLLFFEHYDAVHDGAAPEVLYDIRTRIQEALRTAISSVTLMLGDWYREGGDEPMLCFEVRLRQAPENALQLLCKAPRRRQ